MGDPVLVKSLCGLSILMGDPVLVKSLCGLSILMGDPVLVKGGRTPEVKTPPLTPTLN